jgi:glucokinase
LQQLKANAVANAYRNLPLIVTADIGGTNARLQLWRRETTGAAALAFRQVYRPSAFPSLVVLLRAFIADCAAALQVPILPTVCCLAICGPVWGQGRFNESNNIPAWCPAGKAYCYHDAADIERSLALSAQSVRFLNDFEAIGYCIAAHLDDHATLPAKPSPAPRVLRAGEPDAGPRVLPGAAAACVGAGTGLGCCIVVPAASADPSRLAFNVVPSEAGMAESMCPRSEREWRLLQYLRHINQDESYVEIERIVSGPGLADVCQFLHGECVANREPELKALSDAELKRITDADVEDRPAIVTELARAGNALCLAALDIFLSFYGRALGSVALSVLPTRCGLYIAGGILPKLAWHVPCLGGSASTDALLEGFLQLGPKMSGVVARVPLLLMDDGDVGVKGCLFVALGMIAVKKP